MTELGNHLWQSTLFAAAVAIACFVLRRNRARVRYWLWLAASLKFLVPFSLLIVSGARLKLPPVAPAVTATQVEQISLTFEPVSLTPAVASRWPSALLAVWAAGALWFAARWTLRWRELHRIRRAAARVPVDFPIPVLSAPSAIEPGVFGVFRPVLLLPDGLDRKLDPAQFDAVLAHELCHVRSRDNLTGALHVAVETLFWFHPAVWWIGRRLLEERERACDETVLAQGRAPETYAQGILSICKFYTESPLPFAAGVTGADLKQRIREIMTARVSRRLTLAGKLVLAAGAVVAVAVPLAIGVLRSQTLPPAPQYGYEVVSIRRADPNETNSHLGPGAHGGVTGVNVNLMQILTFAFDVRDFQILGAPAWSESERFNFDFTPDRPEPAVSPSMTHEQMRELFARHRQRMQAILRDRFGMIVRAETRDLPVYVMRVDGKGARLTALANLGRTNLSMNRKEMTAESVPMPMLAQSLATLVGREVIDETGLTGKYDFKLEWTPDAEVHLPGKIAGADEPANADDAGGTSIFTALTEQLGLRLESKKGPVRVYVVEKIERPTEN